MAQKINNKKSRHMSTFMAHMSTFWHSLPFLKHSDPFFSQPIIVTLTQCDEQRMVVKSTKTAIGLTTPLSAMSAFG